MNHLLTAGDRQLDLSTPVCMGVLNTTPDSFSDGAELARPDAARFTVDPDKALQRGEFMLAAGARILDIGGESTRPGAAAVSVQQELDRVIPVLERLQANLDVCLSVDTSSPEVMAEAIRRGVHLINDVRACSRPGAMAVVAGTSPSGSSASASTAGTAGTAGTKVALCLMHMQGQPRTMQSAPRYADVVQQVAAFLQARVDQCVAAGIERSRLLVDPGFGFGKSVAHNFTLLRNLHRLLAIEVPVLVGISRKSMLGAVTGKPVHDRLAASVAAATLALQGGAKIIRSHDVAATVDAIRVHCACSMHTE